MFNSRTYSPKYKQILEAKMKETIKHLGNPVFEYLYRRCREENILECGDGNNGTMEEFSKQKS